jgi:uncharacterized membrane protein YfhO
MGQKRNPPKLYVFDGISRFSEVANESIFKKLTDLDFLTNPVSFTYQDLQGLTSLIQCPLVRLLLFLYYACMVG